MGKVYIDVNIHLGSRVKVQNHVSLFEGVLIEDDVFIGPHVCFTNDLLQRAITPDGRLKGFADWIVTPTLVKCCASIGAGSLILYGVTIGEFALIGAGSMVTRDVSPHALVFGNPASQRGHVRRCARRLSHVHESEGRLIGRCEICEQICYLK